jgi:UDP-2,3-diacylglucosamine hydrolase
MGEFTYFISDLHLSADRPDITQCLLHFLEHEAPHADALYVLGDLFEVWLGDDDITPFSEQIAYAFKSLSVSTPIYFIHGNRDFALKKRYAKRAGFTLLPEQFVIDLYGTPTVLLHGDEMCTRDIEYMKFRKKARSWWWPRLMLALPLSVRRRIAQKGRSVSKNNKQQLANDIMDVTPEEVSKVFEAHHVNQMIHGHTHRPAIHMHDVRGEKATRVVLGDWYTQGSVLRVSASGIELEKRTFRPF